MTSPQKTLITQLFVTVDTVNSVQTVSRLSECTAACHETLITDDKCSVVEQCQLVVDVVEVTLIHLRQICSSKNLVLCSV